VLVTGASSGLGRCLALELSRAGCLLVLTGRNTGRLEAVAHEVRSHGGQARTMTADLSVDGGVEGLANAVLALDPPVDALVNNAGAGLSGPWSRGTVEGDRALFRLLVDAPLALTRALLPRWRARGRGAVLNVASTGAFQPGPQTAVYYAAKASLASWSLALAREERQWLAVTTLCPGALKTGFSQAAGKADVPGAPGPEKTARTAVRAWTKGRGLVVPGVFNAWIVFLSRLLPPAWSAAAVEALQLSVRKR
jgi:hypothetical protein